MNNMDEIQKVDVVKCDKGHLYAANEYKSCPYCKIYEDKKAAEAQRLQAVKSRELHVNTKWENFCIWFEDHFGTLFSVIWTTFKIITAPLRFIAKSGYENRYGEWYRGTSRSEQNRWLR